MSISLSSSWVAIVSPWVAIAPKEVVKEGVLTADGSEQLVIEAPGPINLEGYVDLSNLAVGDEVVLKRYVKIQEGGDYKLHASEAFNGVQEQPLIRFPPIAGYYGIKVTLQQTAGSFKSFPYQFFKEG